MHVESPDGQVWTVRRSVVRVPAGWRWKWRGPRDPGWFDVLNVADLGDLGSVFAAIVVAVLAAVLAILLVFVALAVIEALAIVLLLGICIAAATLLGRPILIRAESGEGGRTGMDGARLAGESSGA